MKVRPLFLVALAVFTTALAFAAAAGKQIVYTKRLSTALLKEPQSLAPVVARVGYARRMSVDEQRGVWLRVSSQAGKGWVFLGNITENPPSEIGGLEGQPIAAAATSATSAARPLSQEANDYASAHDLLNVRDDLLWMEKQADAVKSRHVETYLKAHNKGEYQ